MFREISLTVPRCSGDCITQILIRNLSPRHGYFAELAQPQNTHVFGDFAPGTATLTAALMSVRRRAFKNSVQCNNVPLKILCNSLFLWGKGTEDIFWKSFTCTSSDYLVRRTIYLFKWRTLNCCICTYVLKILKIYYTWLQWFCFLAELWWSSPSSIFRRSSLLSGRDKRWVGAVIVCARPRIYRV